MSDEGPPPKKADAGTPAWVMTFADLMSLLMCFFVLLLAFSEMDVLKFKQLAGSMKAAFGVQRDIKAKEIPKGTSVIAKEFSPGKPDPTVLSEVRQKTQDDMRRHLETETGSKGDTGEDPGAGSESEQGVKVVEVPVEPEPVDATEIRRAFAEEIQQGLIDIETDAQRIVIRIQEKGAFPSGKAALIPRFEPVIGRIGEVLLETGGRIVVAGHPDDIPINTARFRSNWELSAARSVTVVHQLGKVTGLDSSRFLIEGYADTQPLAPNDSPENRARNRRVEIVVVRGNDADGGNLDAMPGIEVEQADEAKEAKS